MAHCDDIPSMARFYDIPLRPGWRLAAAFFPNIIQRPVPTCLRQSDHRNYVLIFSVVFVFVNNQKLKGLNGTTATCSNTHLSHPAPFGLGKPNSIQFSLKSTNLTNNLSFFFDEIVILELILWKLILKRRLRRLLRLLVLVVCSQKLSNRHSLHTYYKFKFCETFLLVLTDFIFDLFNLALSLVVCRWHEYG